MKIELTDGHDKLILTDEMLNTNSLVEVAIISGKESMEIMVPITDLYAAVDTFDTKQISEDERDIRLQKMGI